MLTNQLPEKLCDSIPDHYFVLSSIGILMPKRSGTKGKCIIVTQGESDIFGHVRSLLESINENNDTLTRLYLLWTL